MKKCERPYFSFPLAMFDVANGYFRDATRLATFDVASATWQ